MKRTGCRGSGMVSFDLFIALARLLMLTVRLLFNIILDWMSARISGGSQVVEIDERT